MSRLPERWFWWRNAGGGSTTRSTSGCPSWPARRVLRTIDSPLDDTVPAKRAITVRDPLTFRSGYGEVGFLSPMSPLAQALSNAGASLAEWPFAGTADELMKRLGELPLTHQPGERWLYHTSGEILGVLIARVSGKSLGEFLRERIFGPLGMTDTGFRVPPAKLDRLTPCYGSDMVTGDLVALYDAGPATPQGTRADSNRAPVDWSPRRTICSHSDG